jgi:hypothetical protein
MLKPQVLGAKKRSISKQSLSEANAELEKK